MTRGARLWIVFLIACCFMGLSQVAIATAEPDYAKWGRMAMQETAKRYRAEIVDYKHLGRQSEHAGKAVESFRLLLNNGQRKFAVTVHIRFQLQTEQVLQIQFVEDHQPSSAPLSHFRMIDG